MILSVAFYSSGRSTSAASAVWQALKVKHLSNPPLHHIIKWENWEGISYSAANPGIQWFGASPSSREQAAEYPLLFAWVQVTWNKDRSGGLSPYRDIQKSCQTWNLWLGSSLSPRNASVRGICSWGGWRPSAPQCWGVWALPAPQEIWLWLLSPGPKDQGSLWFQGKPVR